MKDVVTIEGTGPDLDAVVKDWRRIAETRGNPFMTPDWFFATRSAGSVIVAVRHEDGSLLGLLPLVREPWRGMKALRFAGNGIGDRFHPVAALRDEPEVAARCIATLVARGEKRIVFDKCADESGWLRSFSDRGGSRMTLREIGVSSLPRIDLTGRDWEAYLAGLSKNLRSRVRRMERKLIREYGMTVHAVSHESELVTAFETLFRLHDARRNEVGGTSLGSGEHRSQLLAFCRAALEQGWLRLRIMRCEDRAVAAFLGWSLGGKYCFYQSGFDPGWGRLSIGQVNLALAIRDAIEEGAEEFDLLLGDESYKQRFADEDSRKVRSGLLAPKLDAATGVAKAETSLRRVVRSMRALRAGTSASGRD